jgi:PAS domain S-box-containing protein
MSENLSRLILLSLPTGVVCMRALDSVSSLGTDFAFFEANPAFEELTGLKSDGVIGKRLSDICSDPFSLGFDWLGICRDSIIGHNTDLETHVLLTNRWCRVTTSSPEPDVVVTCFTDITDAMNVRQSTSLRSAYFQNLLDAIPDIMYFKDTKGVYIGCNKPFERFFGLSAESLVGKTDSEVYDAETAAAFVRADAEALAAGRPIVNEDWTTNPDGTRMRFRFMKAPIFDACGVAVGIVGGGRDISNTYEIEEMLKASVENFRIFFETIDDMIFIADPQGKVFHVNCAVTRKLGYSYEEIKGMHVLEVHPLDKRKEAEEIFGDMFAGRRDFCPLPLARKDTSLLPVETRVWFGKWDGADCIFGISKDLSREQELLQKLNRVFEVNPTLMAISRIDNRIFTEVNRAFLDTLGYTSDELVGKSSADLNLFVDHETQVKIAEELLATGVVRNQELRVRKKNGEIVTGLFSGETIESQGTKFFLTVMTDITINKRFEQELMLRADFQRILMNLATDYINLPLDAVDAAINRSLREIGEFVSADRAYIFDYDFDRGTTSNSYEWCRKGISPQIENLQDVPVEAVPEWVETHRQGHMLIIPDVSAMPDDSGTKAILEPQEICSLATIPLMAGDSCIGFVGFDSVAHTKTYTEVEISLLQLFSQMLVNFRTRERQQMALEAAKEQADIANLAKSRFLAGMSHEIRTPINGILGYLHLLESRETDPELLGFIKRINSSSRTLATLIDDILDVSKIEAGRLEVENISFDLRAAVEDAVSSFALRAADKGLVLDIALHDDVPYLVLGDPLRLRQVLNNLISNALKFTETGSVLVDVSIASSSPERNEVLFSVRDNGIGMDEETIGRLFRPFVQADGSSTRKYGGTGLGLSISKNLVELMGGSISVESLPARGSDFRFTLPLALGTTRKALPNATGVVSLDHLKGARVLLVEDNEINRELATEVLRSSGVVVETAVDGSEAVDAVQRSPFDVVLMDIQMPVMDGFEATRRIRMDSRFADLPIIAVTADALSSERERAYGAGMNAFVTKPIDVNQLLRTLSDCIGKRRVAPRVSPPLRGAATEPSDLLPDTLQLGDDRRLDVQAALLLLGGEHRLLLGLMHRFHQTQAYAAMDLREDLVRNDLKAAARRIHTIKGLAGSIGATDLLAACIPLEIALPTSSRESVEPLLLLFEHAMSQALEATASFENQVEAIAAVPPSESDTTAGRPDINRLLIDLKALLLQNDLAAVEVSLRLSYALKGTPCQQVSLTVRDMIQRYEYAQAASMLVHLTEMCSGMEGDSNG